MKLSHIIAAIEEFAPRGLQESWDNSGLQIALPPEAGGECTGVLLCVDVSEAVIAEAVEKGCNLVLSHHPLIFKGIKSLTGRTPSERAVAAAVRAGVAVYSAHTSLDSTRGGISHAMAERLGARVLGVLVPSEVRMEKVTVICPRDSADDVLLMLLDDPSGLQPTSWPVAGDTIAAEAKPAEAVPTFAIGHTPLTRVEVTVPAIHTRRIRRALASSPLKLTVSVESLADRAESYGLGVVAEFEPPVAMSELPDRLRAAFGTPAIRSSRGAAEPGATVRRIALCGGAGGEFIGEAIAAGADAYVTADVRYHDFADHREGMAIYDVGHFESENCAKTIFYRLLCEKFPNFAVQNSQLENNPVIYL